MQDKSSNNSIFYYLATSCALTPVRKGGVEVRRTCARVSTLMPTVCSSIGVGGNLVVCILFGQAESTQLRYLS